MRSEPEFKEFVLGDLFQFESVKQAKSQGQIPNDDSSDGIPYVVQSMYNNMFSRNVNKNWLIEHNEPPIPGNRIVLGVTLPAVSYQPKEFGASQVITAKASWLDRRTGMYMVAVLSKMMHRFSYSSKPGLQIYKNMKVKLPVQSNGDPDFKYMEEYIRGIEEEHLRKLGPYLKIIDLS